MRKSKKKLYINSGITLIALVITIIVMLILVGVSLQISSGPNGIIGKAIETSFKQRVSEYKEEVEMYIADKYVADLNFDKNEFNVNKVDGSYKINGTEISVNGIKEVVNSITDEDSDKFVIENGKLKILEDSDENEIQWSNEIGVETKFFSINANIKEIKSSSVIVELELPTALAIQYINLKDSYSNNVVKYENINFENNIMEISAQINIEYDIMICSSGRYYTAKFKIDSRRIGGEGTTINNPEEKYYGYGVNNVYYYKKLSGSQTISNATWGDPTPGISKSVYVLGTNVLVNESKLSKNIGDYLSKKTNAVFDIKKYENDEFNISINGYGMEKIKSAKIYKNDNVEYNGTISNNKFSISGNFSDGDNYKFELIYDGDYSYTREIKLTKNTDVVERQLGSEGNSVNTNGKWYYIKYGADTRWKYKWIYGSNVVISNTFMGGDPAPGSAKAVYLVDTAEYLDIVN